MKWMKMKRYQKTQFKDGKFFPSENSDKPVLTLCHFYTFIWNKLKGKRGVSCNVTGLGPWRCGRQTADVRRLTRPSLLHPRPPITHPTLSLLVTPVPVLPALAPIAPTPFDPACAIFLWVSRVEENYRFDHEEQPQSRGVRSPYFLRSSWKTQRLMFNHSTSWRKLNKPRPAVVYP